MNIGKSITLGLAHREMSLRELCDKTGLKSSNVSSMKNNRRDAVASKLKIIAGGLGYKVSEFIALGED